MKSMATIKGMVEPKVLILAAGLGLALVVVWVSWRLNNPPPASEEKAAPAVVSSSIELMSQEVDQLADVVEARLREDAESIATDWPAFETPKVVKRATVAKKQSGMSFRLRGVVRGGGTPVAFLDDQTLAVGETIEGFKLVDIEDDHVTLQDSRGKKHKLYPESGP